MQLSISATNWIPLSAEYIHDSNLDLYPLSLMWKDGFHLIQQPIFNTSRDVSINQQTTCYLTSAIPFLNIIKDQTLNDTYVGSYILLYKNGAYVTTVNDQLYLSGSNPIDKSLYRLIYNTDGTYSLMQDNTKYVTISTTIPFNLTLQNQIIDSDTQKFTIYSPDNIHIYFISASTNPFTGYGPNKIQRFLSINPSTSAICGIGTITNDYLFEFEGNTLLYSLDGLTKEQTWVQYYNQLTNSKNNNNTNIYASITGLDISRMVNLAYYTKIQTNINSGTMQIDIANLKNIMTPEYEYNIRTIPLNT